MKETTLLSIRDFSEFTGIKQSTLRYYDEIGLLPPISRGENNYRYYVPFQIITLNFISVLTDLGVPLSTIKEMNFERTPESVIDLLDRQEELLDFKLNELQKSYSIIHTFRKNIQSGLASQAGDIGLTDLGEANIVLGPENDFKDKTTFYEPFINFCNRANEYRINLRYPIGGYHYSMEKFLETPNRPNRFFSQDPIGNVKREAGRYLVAYNYGYYGQFPGVPKRIGEFAEDNKLTFTGPVYVQFLLDEISTVDPDKYMSRISVRIKEDQEDGPDV